MNSHVGLKILAVAAILMTTVMAASLYGATFLSSNSLNHVTTPVPVPQQGFTGKAQLGIDCGYGSNEAVYNATGYPGPDGATSTGNAGNPTLDTSCTWAGSPDIAAGGTQLQPLVSDNPTVAVGTSCCNAPSRGGGFSAEVVLIQNATTVINGYDITVSWNPIVLNAVEFDQTGLPFFGGNSFSATSIIDNTAGSAELSQAILSPPAPTATLSGNVTLFRLRFDVVGIGRTGLTISNDLVIDPLVSPNSLKHTTVQGSFDSTGVPDLVNGIPLGYNVNFTFSPNPEVPGSLMNLIGHASCSACTLPLSFSWDTDSVQGYPDPAAPAPTIEATGSPAQITAPTATLLAHRVTLIVTDAAGHIAQATRRLPLTVTPPPATTTTCCATTISLTAAYLGGVPPYSGTTGQVGVKWSLCNSTGLTQTICSNPNPSTTNTPAQLNTISENYKFAGVFTGTVTVTDTGQAQVPGSPTPASASFPVNVTGTAAQQAYTVTVGSNATAGANVGQTVSFTATVAYATAYVTAPRSATFSYTFKFGDGTLAVTSGGLTSSATHKYAAPGTYSVVVIAQETASNALAKIQEVGTLPQPVIGGGPSVAITSAPSTGTVGTAVSFTATASGGTTPYSFSWNFGDGTANVAGGATNPNSQSHTYSSKGTFTVNVNVTDSTSKLASATPATITISALTLALSFTNPPTTGTAGSPVSFTVLASGGTTPYSFSWNFGDGTANVAGGAANPNTQSHTYTAKGTYTVKVNVTDSATGLASATATITIAPLALSVSFTAPPTTGSVNTAISFTASASGGTTPYSFSWSFGDGTANVAGGATNPNTQSHTYATKGTFSVKVNVTDTNNVLASTSTSISITGTPLTVTFTTAPTTGTVNTAVSFTATAAGDTPPYTFSWSFGDGSANISGGSTNPNTQSHTYTAKGTFTVHVNVTDNNGVKQTASSDITIAPLSLAVVFNSPPTTGTVNTALSFTPTASGGTTPYSFSRSFGDGTANVSGGAANPNTQSHTYAVKGTFTVQVNVTDTNAKLATMTTSITIAPLTLALVFDSPPTTGGVATPISFTVTASGGTTPYSFSWNFGDGTANVAGGAANPNTQSHTYAAGGTFTVNVNVTDTNAKLASASSSITITSGLSVTFTTAPTTGTVGTSVSFTATASGGTPPYSFSWNFGDKTANVAGGGTNPNTQSHTYTAKGTYTVKVNVTDSATGLASATATITIAPLALSVSFTAPPTTGSVNIAVSFTVSASGGTTPYSFSWSFGDGTANVAGGATNPNTQSHTYATKGTFTVKV